MNITTLTNKAAAVEGWDHHISWDKRTLRWSSIRLQCRIFLLY